MSRVTHVEILVEEESMEAALREFLPRVLPPVTFEIYRHQGKGDLLKKLPSRLAAYRRWLPDNMRIIVLVDRDGEDCHELKARLESIANTARLNTRTVAGGDTYQIVNRIVIEELEAWYFGDWDAVRRAYPNVPTSVPRQARFRDPDAIRGGTWEAFEKTLKGAGYFASGLRKIECARAIAPHWEVDRNRSRSFRAFVTALTDF
mgnify:CR=1 FL=1